MKRKVKDFLYEDLTYKIRKACYAVYDELGSGHKETVYQKALSKEFELASIPYVSEKALNVIYRGAKVGTYKPDFIADDKVLIEIKALSFLPRGSEVQLAHYLKGTSYKLGLVVNFGSRRLDIRRRIWDKGRGSKETVKYNKKHE